MEQVMYWAEERKTEEEGRGKEDMLNGLWTTLGGIRDFQQKLTSHVAWQQQKYITTALTDSLPVPDFIC